MTLDFSPVSTDAEVSESQSLQHLTTPGVLMDQTQINETIRSVAREDIVALQKAMVPVQCELPEPIHRFAPGIYMRELTVPAGMLIVGKIHRHEHFVMVLSGVAIIRSEFGDAVVTPGYIAMSPAGVKRVVLAVTDTRFITIHRNPSDTQDLAEIEAEHMEPEETLVCASQEALL